MIRLDSHTHITFHNVEELLRQAKEDYNYEKIAIMGLSCSHGRANNFECLLGKALDPAYTYVYGSMLYGVDTPATAADHEKQLQLMLEAGFDGWKILESKPSLYQKLQIPLDSDVFEKAFSFAEENQVRVTWHAGDPATFWSEDTAPEFAVRNHWLCVGEGMPTLRQIYTQVENVLDRHPKLIASLAHLFFTSDDRAHAVSMLEKYPSLNLDLTPGNEMYDNFMKDRAGWYDFFCKYSERLIFGTDMVDNIYDQVFGSQKAIVDLVMKTLCEDKEFTVWQITGKGLGLPEDVLENLFHKNYEKLIAGAPKPINKKALETYADFLLPRMLPEEQKQTEKVMQMIESKI